MRPLEALDAFSSTEFFLKKWCPRDILMPVEKGLKHPAMPHSGGRWSWTKLDQWKSKSNAASTYDACILLQDLCVIDVDDEDMARELEVKFPILHDVPMEKTNRGRHYWFRRSDDADALGYYDGHGQRQQGIDFKTRCRTGTGGIVVIAPSTGKTWVKDRELVSDTLIPIPFDLLDAVSTPTRRMERRVFKFLGCADPIEMDTLGLNIMSYFEPFFGEDGFATCDVIPVPCTRDEYSTLMRVVAYPDSDWIATPTPDEWSIAIRIGNKLGLLDDIDLHKKMTRSRSLWTHDLQKRWPEMAHAIESENAYRRGEGSDESICIDVDEKIRECLVYDPLTIECKSWDLEDISLFGKSGPSTLHVGGRTVVIHDNVLQRVCDKTPRIVMDLMEAFPLVLAGGSVLGIVANRDVVECGHDYDLFVYGLDDDAADDMLETIAIQFLPSPAWRLIQTSNAWTFVEQLGREASDASPLVIQVILRLYRNPYEVAVGFDISAARIAVWAHPRTALLTVQACPSWFETMRRLMIPVEPVDSLFSKSTSMRIVKYAGKGFDVMFPGLRKSVMSTHDKAQRRKLKGVRVLTFIHERLGGRWPDTNVRRVKLPSIVRSIRYSLSDYAEDEVKVTMRFIYALASIPWACMRAVKRLFGGGRGETKDIGDRILTLWRKFGDRQPSAFKHEKPDIRNLHCQDSRFEVLTCETLGIQNRVGTSIVERMNVMLQLEVDRNYCNLTEMAITVILSRMYKRMRPLEDAMVDTAPRVFRRVSELVRTTLSHGDEDKIDKLVDRALKENPCRRSQF